MPALRSLIRILLLAAGMSFARSAAQAQCYPGLPCVEGNQASSNDTASLPRPNSPREDCTLDGSLRYCVSSALAAQGSNTYRARNLVDDQPKTAWVEGKSDNGVGEWIVVDFDQKRTPRSLTIRNGYGKSADIFSKNGRIKDIEIRLSNGKTLRRVLEDTSSSQTINLDDAGSATWLQLVIVSVYPGWKYADTAISELRVNAE